MRRLSICLILLTSLGAVSARSTRARAEADDGRITRPSSGAGSVPRQCRPAQHISTVSTYHAYKREGLRPY
jgi:hypothetical protein